MSKTDLTQYGKKYNVDKRTLKCKKSKAITLFSIKRETKYEHKIWNLLIREYLPKHIR